MNKVPVVFTAREDVNRRLLRARDAIDRRFAEPLDVPALAQVAYMSPAHFTREFKATFGETPHRYLQRRRVERAMALLRDSATSVTDVGMAVGFTSIGTFSRTFAAIVGVSPTIYRAGTETYDAPGCAVRAWTRPATSVSATRPPDAVGSARRRPRNAAVSEKRPAEERR